MARRRMVDVAQLARAHLPQWLTTVDRADDRSRAAMTMRLTSITSHGLSRSSRLCAGALCCAVAVLGMLVHAARAGAVAHHPKGVFEPLAYCPFNDPELDLCQVAVTTGGELRIGRMVVPITRTFEGSRGGWNGPPGSIELGLKYALPEEGGPGQVVALPVPGGLAGVIEPAALPTSLRTAFNTLVSAGLGGLTTTMEVAGPPSSVKHSFEAGFLGVGVALEEPMKIKMTNPFLGENCYIGSDAEPIKIEATEGTTSPPPPNKPIKGAGGSVMGSLGAIVIAGNSVVDNAFAVPAASGCGGSLAPLVDRAIDAKLGLPSPAGRNSEILDTTVVLALPSSVLESE